MFAFDIYILLDLLKLYCECFSNGVYCQIGKCNCNNCHNNAENNDLRKEAVEATLERNPNAFRSKIFVSEKTGDMQKQQHHKGCHCKKSNCLKKYVNDFYLYFVIMLLDIANVFKRTLFVWIVAGV